MKRRGLRLLAVLGLVVFCLGLFCRGGVVYANSAQRYWHGSTSVGSFTVDENCPLEVEHEKLTFDIPHFPEHYRSDEESLSRYEAKVTAEYEFYNPADYDVTAKLVFPFGLRPSYIYPDIIASEADRYAITVNGEKVEKTLRHTYKPNNGVFDIDEELPKIRDGYAADEFFAPELSVTEYVYMFEKIDNGEYSSPYAEFEVRCGENTRVMMSGNNGVSHDGDSVKVGVFAKNYDRVSVYAIGEPLSDEQLPQWTVYKDGGAKDKIEGVAVLSRTENMSFLDLVTEEYDEKGVVSKVDWYNAAVDSLNERIDTYGGKYLGIGGFNLDYHLMRWYEYELNVKSGERITNAVTAPLYPTIDEGFEPPVYLYQYLASPAKTWKKFGALDIAINTPYYMTDNGGLAFEKTDGGYKLALGGLPENEIVFSLCEVETPKRVKNNVYTVLIVFGVLILVGVLLAFGAVIFAVVMIVGAYRKAHPKNKSDDGEAVEESVDSAAGENNSDGENTIE